MRSVPNFRQPELRERVTQAIFGMLTQMPEPERNIFVWTHYRGYSPKQIAELAKCSVSEVEATLHTINLTLYRKTRSLIDQDSEENPATDTPSVAEALSGRRWMTPKPFQMTKATQLQLCPHR